MAPALLVFGDSLADVGNAFGRWGGEAFPCPPHWQGRRCDGPLWVEGLAAGLDLPPLRHSLAGGDDHAWGGARSGAGLSPKGRPNLLEQVERFLAVPGAVAAVDPLVVLRAGANDYLDAPPGPALAAAVNANLLAAVTRLAEAGLRRFLVPSELLWGWAPLQLPGLGEPQRQALNALISSQNQALRRELEALAAARQLLLVQPDFEALLRAVHADPAGHGFRELQRPALVDPVPVSAPSAEGFLWWDGWGHLTAAFHRLLAQQALASLGAAG